MLIHQADYVPPGEGRERSIGYAAARNCSIEGANACLRSIAREGDMQPRTRNVQAKILTTEEKGRTSSHP